MRGELMEWISPEIWKWLVYGLMGYAVFLYLFTTLAFWISGSDEEAYRNVTKASAYVCATLLMAIGIQLLIGKL